MDGIKLALPKEVGNETISRSIEQLMDMYKRTGQINGRKPKTTYEARQLASKIAHNQALRAKGGGRPPLQ
jgi:hypothetical protein